MMASPFPPGPKGHLLFGNLHQFSRDPLGFIEGCARDHGDVVRLRILNNDAWLVNHPDLIEEVLVTKSRHFIKDRSLRQRVFKRMLGTGLLTSEGDFWRRQRRLSQPAFHRDRIAAYGQTMVQQTASLMESWECGETRNVHEEMMKLTLQIVGKTLFNSDVAGEAVEVGEALEVAMDRLASGGSLTRVLDNFLPTPGWFRLNGAVRRLDKIVFAMIGRSRATAGKSDDLLSMMIAARDEDGTQMSDQQLRDEVMTFFLAGHETTALALSWTLYLLATHPEVESALVDELRRVLGGRQPGVADIAALPCSERVIKESMRLYPPVWSIGRESTEDCTIGDFNVPAGTQVFMAQWTMHRDGRFFAEPLEFKPERWTAELLRTLPKFAYFPFGGGPRLCIGNQFAMMEATLILAAVVQKFHFDLSPGQQIVPWPSVTLRPKHGIKLSIVRR